MDDRRSAGRLKANGPWRAFRAAREKLRADFALAIITMTGTCGVIGISPSALYRLARGDLLLGVIEAAVVLSITASVVYAWRTRRTRVAAWFDAVLTTAGSVIVVGLLGEPGLRWLYAVVVVNFLLLEPRPAGLSNVLARAVLMRYQDIFTSP